MFPRLSETFILNEVLELERQGVHVDVFSLMAPGDGRFHGEVINLKPFKRSSILKYEDQSSHIAIAT